MAITTNDEAVAARDKAQHLFHAIENKVAALKALLVDLDAYVAPIVDGGAGTVHPMDGTNKPPG